VSRYMTLDHMTTKSLVPKSIFKFLRSDYQPCQRTTFGFFPRGPFTLLKLLLQWNFFVQHNQGSPTMESLCQSLIAVLHANTGSNKPFTKKTPKDSACHICSKFDHWSSDCPLSAKGAGSQRNKPTYKQAVSKGKPGEVNWKRVAPKNQDRESKMVNRTEWCWCSKCDCWTKFHGTKTHGSNKAATTSTTLFSLTISPTS